MRLFTVPGWPAKVQGHSAATPGLTRAAGSGAQQYKDGLTGQPGTLGIPVQPVVPSPDPGDLAQAGISRSSDARNVFYPNQYWARPQRGFWPGAGQPVAVTSANMMPVPAVDPRGTASRLSFPIVQRGQKQIPAIPVAAPRWS
jgi:hypothetical protein